MKKHSEITACVVDFGMVGVPMAERLSREYKRVLLYSEWEEKYSCLNRAVCGEGFSSFERVYDFWEETKDVDLFVFPDVQRAGMQLELERRGKAVWGSRKGDAYELDRELLLNTLKETGLEVPPCVVVVGLDSLRDFLKEKKDYYIKVSLFRGSFETSHFRSMAEDKWWLDSLGVRFGPASELVRFLCFPNIKTLLEIGADTYNVLGQWPDKVLHGVEWKDRCYLGVVTPFGKMPKQIRDVFSAIGPKLGERGYRNQFSMEVRVKGAKSYFTDATCRMGLPSTASQLELYENLGEIIWHGANGELVQPKIKARYSAEGVITFKGEKEEWRTCIMPKELEQWCKFKDVCKIGELTCFPGDPEYAWDEVGWLVAIGDSVEDASRKLCKQADLLPDGMECNTECLPYVVKEIHEMEKQGIHFGAVSEASKPPSPGAVAGY